MAARNSAVCRLCVLFLLVSTSTLSSASDPSLCSMPSPAPQNQPAGEHALSLLCSLELNAGGYFFGGEDIHFTKDESNATSHSYVSRSLSLLPSMSMAPPTPPSSMSPPP
ncbi:hypothetical protein BAE44_0020294 [Dichanthelium oligosanthes]|uniref:Uncharacterized protein n=1 Tax=Dichanthelium oligosanthes TaxID=888268 RepID=A0A1E5V0V1_9POAL|nr:hypothetical protein BAE44_0020294 [Dichanthelium oligosanthes]